MTTASPSIARGLILLVLITTGPRSLALDDKERDRHQGTWRAVSFVYDGTETSKEVVESITRTVEGDHVVWKRSGKNFAGTKVALDPSKDPKTIEVIADGGPNRDKPVLGIYRLEGDELTICMASPGKECPKTLEAPKRSGLTLMKFRRVK